MNENDLPLVLNWRNNPEIRKYMYTQHEISLEEHNKWFAELNPEKTKYYMFEIENDPIGVINFTKIEKSKRQAMWGFYSGDLSKRGVGKLMEIAALKHAFTNLNLLKLSCEVLSNNMNVVNFHRKFGFSIEGIFRNHFESSRNEVLDIYRLAITKKEWQKSLTNDTRLKVGEKYSTKIKVTPELINHFGQATGDMNPIHFDEKIAKNYGFETTISHGILPLGLISKILGTEFPGNGTIYTNQTIKFMKPILQNSEITISLKVLSILGRKVFLSTDVTDSVGDTYISGEATILAPKNNL